MTLIYFLCYKPCKHFLSFL